MDNPHTIHHCASIPTLFMLRLQLSSDSTTHTPHTTSTNTTTTRPLPPQLIQHPPPPNSTSHSSINYPSSQHWKRCSAIVVASSHIPPHYNMFNVTSPQPPPSAPTLSTIHFHYPSTSYTQYNPRIGCFSPMFARRHFTIALGDSSSVRV